MNKSKFLFSKYANKFYILLLLLLLLPFSLLGKKNKLNVIIILIDDLGWMDLGYMGSTFYETPNIDKLRGQGMMFTNAYSASPVSSPSRASILTGKNPAHLQFTGHITAIGRHRYPETGLIIPPHDKMYVDTTEVMISEALKPAGYKTISIGKWHVGDKEMYMPTCQGFDINIAGYEHGSPPTHWAPYKNPDLDWNSELKNLTPGNPGEYLTDRLTDEAIKFIRNNSNEPFFMYLSHYAVHTPLEAPAAIVKKYEEKMKTDKSQKSAVYAAMIEAVDKNIGKLLKELDIQGLTNNTIIFLTSDNGGTTEATINTPLREGKGFLYEGGIRIPLIIRWPGIAAENSICDQAVITDDFYPTIMDMVGEGTKLATDIDGKSLVPLLLNNDLIDRDMLCWYYPHYSPQAQMPGSAIRKGNYKLIQFYDPYKIELYNLKTDLGENNNIANENSDIVQNMRMEFDSWLKKMNPVLHTQNPAHK